MCHGSTQNKRWPETDRFRRHLGGLIFHTPTKDQQFRLFLETELRKFKIVDGPTHYIVHRIRIKPGMPIKQRYCPPIQNPAIQKVINKEVERYVRRWDHRALQ